MQFSGRPTPRLIGAIIGITLALGVFAWMRGRDVEIEHVTSPPPQGESVSLNSALPSDGADGDSPPAVTQEVPPGAAPPPPVPTAVAPTPRFEVSRTRNVPRRKITLAGTLVLVGGLAQTAPRRPDFSSVVVRAPAYKVEAFPSEGGEFTMLLDVPSTQNHVRLEVEWPGMIFAGITTPPAFGVPSVNVPLDREKELTRAKIEMRRLK
jgi:hypothetical protein